MYIYSYQCLVLVTSSQVSISFILNQRLSAPIALWLRWVGTDFAIHCRIINNYAFSVSFVPFQGKATLFGINLLPCL